MVGIVPQILKSLQLKLVFGYTSDIVWQHCPASVTGKHHALQQPFVELAFTWSELAPTK